MIPPGYTVLEDGTIIGKRGRPLKPNLNRSQGREGYLVFSVYDGRKSVSFYVHQVVCEAFHGPKPFPEAQVRHLDGNKLNCAASNLAWGTAVENAADRVLHGTSNRGARTLVAKLNEQQVREIRERFRKGEATQVALASEYGVDQTNISRIILRKSWSHL